MEENFTDEIEDAVKARGKSRDEYIDTLKHFYNGYRFSKKPLTVYNPFGLLYHFKRNGEFMSYWYETGTPTFLIKMIVNQNVNIAELTNLQVEYEDFGKYDIEDMKLEPLLYQSGYLTIVDYDGELDLFTLGYPNEEVKTSFSKSLMNQYFKPSAEISAGIRKRLPNFLIKGEIEKAIDVLKSFFSSTPYDIIEEKEKYYELAIHLIFSIFGLDCRSEVRTSSGRIDTLVITSCYVYCFEFKLSKSAQEAIAQIDEKDYLLPWKYSGKKLFKIGINFDHEKRNISDYIVEKIDS